MLEDVKNITWIKLCPCRSKKNRIGTMICWDKDALKTERPDWQPFKGHAVNTSSRCRKLNSLMQMYQPLWESLEQISFFKKQLKEIEAFRVLSLKRKSTFSESNFSPDSDGIDGEVDFVQWADFEKVDSFRMQCSFRPKPNIANLETAYSPMMNTEKFKAGLTKVYEVISDKMKIAVDDVLRVLKESTIEGHDLPFVPGPVGDSPLHTCFLFGLKQLGMKIVTEYYNTPELLSVPYFNDLDPWRKLDGERLNDNRREDGLYTGETVLHIAIVKEDLRLVTHFLQLGIEISSRATGAFFQPKLLKPLSVELKRWHRWKAWLLCVKVEGRKFADISHIENKDSGTYYGEFPLSFAASVGNVEICNVLYFCKKLRIESQPGNAERRMTETESLSCGPRQCIRPNEVSGKSLARMNQHIGSLHFDNKQEKLMSDFLHAADNFGNTALHMAVWHQRKDIIDTLVSKQGPDGIDGLSLLNHDSFTPLTLAARRGFVDIFHHILHKHMGKTAWEFGKVFKHEKLFYFFKFSENNIDF